MLAPGLLGLCSSLSHAQPATQQITATLSMTSGSALELRYDLPAACRGLTFLNSGITPSAAAAMRGDWNALDGCAEVDASGITLKNPACTSARFRIPVTTNDLDRVYPWAYPFENGIFSHTSAFAVAPSCGQVQWKFALPDGVIVVDGKVEPGQAERSHAQAGINYAPVVFLQQRSAGNLYIDARLPPETAAFIQRSMDDLYALYTTSLPGIAFRKPFTVAIRSDNPGSFRGDVANRGTMRLTVPAVPDEAQRRWLRPFIAHEISHVLQPQELKDVWQDDTDTIKEGGAEFMAWMASAQLGWRDRAALAGTVEQALNGCLLETGGKNWQQVANRKWGQTPYRCGMSLHLLGLGDRAAAQPAALMLRDYYQGAEGGKRTNFAAALECGNVAGCTPKWLPRAMGPDESFAKVLAEFGVATKLFKPAVAWNPDQVVAVARATMRTLMAADCKGQISFYQTADSVKIAPVQSCANLREGMIVTRAEGLPMFTDRGALLAIVKACRGNGKVSLGLQDGARVELACDKNMADLPTMYSVDIERLLPRLGIAL